MPSTTTRSLAEHLSDALTAAGYTVGHRDNRAPYAALTVAADWLPGELWLADRDGQIHYPADEFDGLFLRYLPDPEDGSRWHTLYESETTDLTADTAAMLRAVDRFHAPASEQLDRQMRGHRAALAQFRDELTQGWDAETHRAYQAATAELRSKLERIAISAVIEDARPYNRQTVMQLVAKEMPHGCLLSVTGVGRNTAEALEDAARRGALPDVDGRAPREELLTALHAAYAVATCPRCSSHRLRPTVRCWVVCEGCKWGGLEAELTHH
jgi:hypothetical protein